MPNFKTTIPFIVNLQVYEHSAKLLACIHVIQCMIEHYFTYNWIIDLFLRPCLCYQLQSIEQNMYVLL